MVEKKQFDEVVEAAGAVPVRDMAPQQCDLCGKIAETRPYGPHGESVCFKCGMKDEASAQRAFESRFSVAESGRN